MRRFSILTLSLIAPALFFLAGCGGEEKKEPEARAPRERKKEKKEKAAELEAPTDGTIKGRVVVADSPPKMESLAPQMEKNQDKSICLSGKDFEKHDQTWILAGDGKGVANVVIKLVPPAGKKFKQIPPEKSEVDIDQPHCAFIPHVVAVKQGQVLKILNSAAVPHNTKAVGQPGENEEQNSVIPPGGSKTLQLNPQKEPVQLSCQIHPWMSAKVYVSDSPYIATTDADGNFELKNVPSGVTLKIEAIHPGSAVKSEDISLKAGETKTVDLKITPK
jgi:plastocyanin